MAKSSKLTIKHFENTLLKKKDDQFYPIYLNITYKRKVTSIKSPSFELITKMNMAINWIYDKPEIIEQNDIRLINNIRKYYEQNDLEFSVFVLKSTENLFKKLSMSFYEALENDFKTGFISFFHNKKQFVNTEMMAVSSFNYVYFIDSLKELNPKIYEDLLLTMPTKFKILEEIMKLHNKGIIPFIADYQLNEPFLNEVKKLEMTID